MDAVTGVLSAVVETGAKVFEVKDRRKVMKAEQEVRTKTLQMDEEKHDIHMQHEKKRLQDLEEEKYALEKSHLMSAEKHQMYMEKGEKQIEHRDQQQHYWDKTLSNKNEKNDLTKAAIGYENEYRLKQLDLEERRLAMENEYRLKKLDLEERRFAMEEAKWKEENKKKGNVNEGQLSFLRQEANEIKKQNYIMEEKKKKLELEAVERTEVQKKIFEIEDQVKKHKLAKVASTREQEKSLAKEVITGFKRAKKTELPKEKGSKENFVGNSGTRSKKLHKEKGSEENSVGNSGTRSKNLVEAVQSRNSAAVKKALQMGADPNSKLDLVKDGKTYPNVPALFHAVYFNQQEITQLIASAPGVNVDAYGPIFSHGPDSTYSRTPLIRAAFDGHTYLCRVLLDNEANPNGMDGQGYHSIYAAAEGGHREVIEVLISRGGDPHKKVKGWMTADAIARQRGFTELANWLSRQTKK